MGYSEFPSTNYNADDMSEFICVYKKLLGNYEGTLKKISDLTVRLNNYEKNMDAYLYELRYTYVPNAVKDALTKEMVQYQNELNAIRQSISTLSSTVEQLSIREDQRFAELTTSIAQLDNKMQLQVVQLQKQIENVQNQLMKTIQDTATTINGRIDRLQAEMIVRDTATLDQAKAYTDSKISDVMHIIDQIKVEIDKASIRWLWDHAVNFGGYTAQQWYEDVTITADMWHDKEFSCIDWYIRGREVFHWWDRRNMMFSPVTGKWVDIRQAIYEICNVLKPAGITAQEYEELQITAQEYEKLQITGFEYDWYGKEKLNVFKNNRELSVAAVDRK